MNKSRWIRLTLVCWGMILVFSINLLSARSKTNGELEYREIERSQYFIHAIIVPEHSNYSVVPEVSGELQPISEFAQDNVIAAINGGYFDPINQKTTSFIVKESRIVADPRFNERLVDNPDLKPYLGKILNRTEFRRYSCGEQTRYDIQLHFSPIPDNCTLKASLGAGPSLLPQDTSIAEGFVAYQDGAKIRDAIGEESLNARSAVGITKYGDVILVMVAQQSEQPLNSGISLSELANVLADLGAIKAMNLDGGSSASLYYDGQAYYGRVDREGNKILRPIASVLSVMKE